VGYPYETLYTSLYNMDQNPYVNLGGSTESAEHSSSPPLATFHPFTKLPLEIRIMIWTIALGPLPDPRLIQVSMTSGRKNPGIPPEANKFFDKDAPKHSMAPLILAISKESRSFAGQYYDFCFQRKPFHKSSPILAGSRFENPTYPGILFQPARDIISFAHMSEVNIQWALRTAKCLDLKLDSIQSLAIPYTNSSFMLTHQVFRYSGEGAAFLPQSKELIVVSRSGISKPTTFETRLKLILSGFRDSWLEDFMAKLRDTKRGINRELRAMTGMQNVPAIRLMDSVTLNRWLTEPQFRKDGLPWDW
jgi:hypothetical protein